MNESHLVMIKKKKNNPLHGIGVKTQKPKLNRILKQKKVYIYIYNII